MEKDILILEEKSNFEIKDEATQGEVQVKYCLNCGTEVNDRFCPHCGQSTATPSKLKMKNFGKGLLMSFGRLTPGFLNTAKGLMFHPWTVIRDHIHGRHIPYSPPITMVIQVFLYSTILLSIIDSFFGTDLNIEEGLWGYNGDNEILKMIDGSVVFSTLLAGIPICFGVYLAYYRHGARKYNFAEYLAAFVYFFTSITLWDLFFTLWNLIPGVDFDMNNLTYLVLVGFSIIILWKAFPQDRWWKSVALLVWCIALLLLSVIILGVLISKLKIFFS